MTTPVFSFSTETGIATTGSTDTGSLFEPSLILSLVSDSDEVSGPEDFDDLVFLADFPSLSLDLPFLLFSCGLRGEFLDPKGLLSGGVRDGDLTDALLLTRLMTRVRVNLSLSLTEDSS